MAKSETSSASYELPALPAPVNPDDLRLGDVMYVLSSTCDLTCLPSLSSLLRSDLHSQRHNVFLIGFPYDEGTARNGGRVGGCDGPDTVFRLLRRMGPVHNPECDVDLSSLNIFDLGSIEKGLSLESAHSLLSQSLTALLSSDIPHCVPIVVGGSNDQSYPNARSLLSHFGHINVVNIDAHLDVRPLKNGQVHSGSPFRLLLEDDLFRSSHSRFAEFAAQGNQCSLKHAEFVTERGHVIRWMGKMRESKETVTKQFVDILTNYLQSDSAAPSTFVSFDVDSISSSDCPGVSAPASYGLSAMEALEMAMEAGRNPHVVAMDLSEFNPRVEDYRTGKLVGNIIYYFIMGIAQRKKGKNTDEKKV